MDEPIRINPAPVLTRWAAIGRMHSDPSIEKKSAVRVLDGYGQPTTLELGGRTHS